MWDVNAGPSFRTVPSAGIRSSAFAGKGFQGQGILQHNNVEVPHPKPQTLSPNRKSLT